MKRFEDQIDIAAPATRVFDYVADFTRHSEWAGNGLGVTKTSDGPVPWGARTPRRPSSSGRSKSRAP